MKKILLSLALILASTSAFAERFERDAVILSSRIIACGDLPSKLLSEEYQMIGADTAVTVPESGDMPSTSESMTHVIFGKGPGAMGRYDQYAQLEIRTKETCYGSPESDGVCTEVVLSCVRKSGL